MKPAGVINVSKVVHVVKYVSVSEAQGGMLRVQLV